MFDGACVLCVGSARRLMAADRSGRFDLAASQGVAGRAALVAAGLNPDDPESFVLIEGGRAFVRSDAVIAVLSGLGGAWRAAGAVRLIPRPLRDAAYLAVARNRFRLFGRRPSCWVPDAEQARRVLP
ncbi:MAG TPA: DCC1-like thiol-disulfide oxidoreductase family protein [Caulobacteraceae bacterium]